METYWIGWCRTGYSAKKDGYTTHATEENSGGKALCGVTPTDYGWGLVPDDGFPGCLRCRAALRKLGVMPSDGAD